MVLPPSAAHDASGEAEAAWLRRIKLSLALNRAGLLVLVDQARPEHLGELVRALLPEHPELEVYTGVREVLGVAAGSTLVLAPRPEDADWLNLNRPVFARQQLRVILFCDTETSIALARVAVDFFDWISLRVECPQTPPRFAVAGIRCSLNARAPGVVWTGGDLDAAFSAARPRRRLRRLSAELPYPELVRQARDARSDWLAWTDVDSDFRVWRVRWALIEAGRRGRSFLVEPGARSPGWWTVHARVTGLREAREKLASLGARAPGRLAALVDLEPEAVELLGSLLPSGETALEAELMSARDPGARLAHLARQQGLLPAGPIGNQSPSSLRGLGSEAKNFALPAVQPDELRRKLESGQPVHEEAEALFRQLLAMNTATPSLRVRQYRETVVVLANALNQQGQYDEAEALLRKALSVEEVAGADAPFYATVLEALAKVLVHQGKYGDAETLLRQALAMREKALGATHSSCAVTLCSLALVLSQEGRDEEADENFQRAQAIQEHNLETVSASYATTLHGRAQLRLRQGRYDEAEQLLRQTRSIEEEMPDPGDQGRGSTLRVLANVLLNQGKYGEAEALLNQSLSIDEKALGASHPEFGSTLRELADVLTRQGRYAEAERSLTQALMIDETVLGVRHPSYGLSLHALATVLAEQGKYSEAKELLKQALAIQEATLGTSHREYGVALSALGGMLEAQGRYPEAERLFKQALSILEKTLGANHPSLAPVLSNLGVTLAQQGRAAEGQTYAQRGVAVVRNAHGERHPETAQAMVLLAQVQGALGHPEAAETARQALELLEATLGSEHPVTVRATPLLHALIERAASKPALHKQ